MPREARTHFGMQNQICGGEKNIFLHSPQRGCLSIKLDGHEDTCRSTNWIKKTRVVSCFSEAITQKISILSIRKTHKGHVFSMCVREHQFFRCDKTSLHFIAVDYTMLRFHWCAIRYFFINSGARICRKCRTCRTRIKSDRHRSLAVVPAHIRIWNETVTADKIIMPHVCNKTAAARLSNIRINTEINLSLISDIREMINRAFDARVFNYWVWKFRPYINTSRHFSRRSWDTSNLL
jgi:hypothetical protein